MAASGAAVLHRTAQESKMKFAFGRQNNLRVPNGFRGVAISSSASIFVLFLIHDTL